MKKSLLLVVTLLLAGTIDLNAQVFYWDVEVANIAPSYANQASGLVAVPEGNTEGGPLLPGKVFQFEVPGAQGGALHFASMMVQSNDLFFAPDSLGIPFYNEDGSAMVGDVTSYIQLWDAGTEVNEAPGEGPNQPLRQSDANTGDDEGGVVQVVNDAFTYPGVAEMIRVNMSPIGENMFRVRVQNISAGTIETTGGAIGTPLTPIVWVSTSARHPFFTDGEADRGEGLEGLAEDGNFGPLNDVLTASAGINTVFAPVAWATHMAPNPFFTDGEAAIAGLETLAEDGGPPGLVGYANMDAVTTAGANPVPVEGDGPGPIGPGGSYKFTISSKAGGYLSAASMFVQSNDLFIAPSGMGIALWDDASEQISGDITSEFLLWDAGTEKNQLSGFGKDQAPRQAGPNTGSRENGLVRLVDDGQAYPDLASVVRVTLTPSGRVPFTIRIENISTDATLTTSTGTVAVPEAPGVFTVAPVGRTFFSADTADRGQGLEGLAEDGAAGGLGDALGMKNGFDSGVFAVPVGATDPGPLLPGNAYEFTFEASPGAYLNFATMMVQSNDLFFGPSEMGISLWGENGFPISGDITDQIMLWDAGTEVNEAPGEGLNQAPRQSGANTGDNENATVSLVADGFTYPAVSEMIVVTVIPTATVNEDIDADLPSNFKLNQNYPNPFNPTTSISFTVAEAAPTSLQIYDVSGRLVDTLFEQNQFRGSRTIEWNAKSIGGEAIPSGVYFYKLTVGNKAEFKSMVLMK